MFFPRFSHRRVVPRQCVVLLVLALAAVSLVWGNVIQSGARLRGEAVRVCLRIVAAGDDPADVPECGGASFASAASSSSSSSQAAASSASSAPSGDSVPGEQSGNGGRRYSVEVSRSRVISLLNEWVERHQTLHAAPPADSPDSETPLPGDMFQEWYFPSLQRLIERGILGKAQDLRPYAGATRAEVAIVVTRAFGSGQVMIPDGAHFMDVRRGEWYFSAIENAAYRGWMLGYKDCYGHLFCNFRPLKTISRAESARVITRVLSLPTLHRAPLFRDVPTNVWYAPVIQVAADHCILQGDDDGNVRPGDAVTRAEFFVMFDRALLGLQYGSDCVRSPSMRGAGSLQIGLIDERNHPSATSGGRCIAGPLRCLLGAFGADVRMIGSGLLAYLPSWMSMSPAGVPPTELVLWLTLVLVLLLFLQPIIHLLLRGRKSRVEKEKLHFQ